MKKRFVGSLCFLLVLLLSVSVFPSVKADAAEVTAYNGILNQYIELRNLYNKGNTSYTLMDSHPLVNGYLFDSFSRGNKSKTLLYALEDLNKDGTKELIVAYNVTGYGIYSVYTIRKGAVTDFVQASYLDSIIQGGGLKTEMYVFGDNTIGFQLYGNVQAFWHYKYDPATKQPYLAAYDSIRYSANPDGDNPDYQKNYTAAGFDAKVYRDFDWQTLPYELFPLPQRVRGDVDGIGGITASDARLTLRAAVGLDSIPAGTEAFTAADVDKDGKITAADARLILRAAVGLEQLSE